MAQRNKKTRVQLLAASFLMGLVFSATTYMPTLSAQESSQDLEALSSDEIRFLIKNCPEVNQVVSTGAAVVYGEIIQAPILVTTLRDHVYLNGFQIEPKQQRDKDYLAKKRAGQIHAQFYVDEKNGLANLSQRSEARVRAMKDAGKLDDYSLKKGGEVDVSVGEGRYLAILGSLPAPLYQKYDFMLRSLFRVYDLRKEETGPQNALTWLRTRLDELKKSGVIEKYDIPSDQEVLNVKFVHSFGGGGMAFGDFTENPEARDAYKKLSEAKTPEIKAEGDSLVKQLRENRLLIFSFVFQKALPNDPKTISLLESIREGHESEADIRSFKEKMSLSTEESNGLLEELR